MTKIRGIDISHWQGIVNFEKVKAAGIDFVIMKAGGEEKGFYTDRNFEHNYKAAIAAGLHVGAYYFIGKSFIGDSAGVDAAHRFQKIIKGKKFDYPVFVDIETTDKQKKHLATRAAVAFCEEMEKAGYFVGIYASDISGFKERLNLEDLKPYTLWVAKYGERAYAQPTYVKDWHIWQYTSKGKVPGVSGSVDLDESKTDYAKIIAEKGFNGYTKKRTKKEEK